MKLKLVRSSLGTCLNVFRGGSKHHIGNVFLYNGRWYHDRVGCEPAGYPSAEAAAQAIAEDA